jgi:hypothetical protein
MIRKGGIQWSHSTTQNHRQGAQQYTQWDSEHGQNIDETPPQSIQNHSK